MLGDRIGFGRLESKTITWTQSYDMLNYVCDNALFIRPMHAFGKTPKKGLSWEDSDLYKWLNSDFKELICSNQKEIDNIRSVTLLSEGDLTMMYKTADSRILKPISDANSGQNAIWWLRHTSPITENAAKYVFEDGSICSDAPVSSDGIYVRPVISLFNSQNYKI